MNKKVYYLSAASIFSIVAIAHLLRALNGWEVIFAGVVIPLWVSWIVAGIAGYLAMRGFQLGRK